MNRSVIHALLAGSLLALPAPAGEVVPWGDDFLVGTFEFGTQGAAAAMSPDGSFALGWDAGFCCMGAAGYDGFARYVGDWDLTLGFHESFDPIDVANLADDDFVVTWETYNPAFEPVILARRFALDGTPAGSGVEVVNGADGSANVNPAVAPWPANSDFIVTWARQAPGTPGALNIHIDAFPVLKVPAMRASLGSFQVNTYTPGDQDYPELSVAADSSLVVVWRSDGSPGSDDQGKSVQARWFSPAGNPAAQFQVNMVATGDQRNPDVAMAPDGRFLVVWDGASAGPDSDRSIQGRLFDSAQTPLGPDFQINSQILGVQSQPAVESQADGSFLVVWRSATGVWSRVVGAEGDLAGSDQRVNATVTEFYFNPRLAGALNGRFVVSWDTEDIFYGNDRRARLLRSSLFSDGFESGDTNAWSNAVP